MVRRLAADGFTTAEAADIALADGASPGEVIKALKFVFGVGIGDGKTIVDAALGAERRATSDYLRCQAELVARIPDDLDGELLEARLSEVDWNRRLWALITKGRTEDAYQAIERFDPISLSFAELTEEEALDLVERHIATWRSGSDEGFAVMGDATTPYDFGWTFAVQSSRYLRTGNFHHLAVGHGLLLVDRHLGTLWVSGSAAVDPAANYLATGCPHHPALSGR